VAYSPRRGLWIAGVALVVAMLAAGGVVIVGTPRQGGGKPAAPFGAGSSAARGEVIFQTGHDASGAVIPRSGNTTGGGMMGGSGMGGGMMRASCASCHGRDGRGRTMATFTAPNITYTNLTDPKGMLAPDGSRGPLYTDAAIRTAVTTGIDPTGAHLEAPMPQWQLSDQQWGDLLAYVKTLH
jgi:mono/diheme cytochrome c family protein